MATSLSSIRDLLMPAIWDQGKNHPEVEIDVSVDLHTDSLIIRTGNKTTGLLHSGCLFTRAEIDDRVYIALFHERLLAAIKVVKPISRSCDPGAAEYEEIMEACNLMDKIQP